ncbi:putative histone acetyltransferase HAC-like 3, partial [Dichanthelium oligosanthes]
MTVYSVSSMTWCAALLCVSATSMMTQTLQGKVMASNVLSSFSIRQQMSPSDFELLQPDNMDQSTSPIRSIIIQKIATCLKTREQFAKFSPDYLLNISRNIDELLYRCAPKVSYMDLNTLEVRVNALVSSVSYRNHRDSLISSAASPAKNLQQLPGIQMADSTVYHDIVAPSFTNLPACARDVPTHTMCGSQRYVPHNLNVAAANFPLTVRPESFRSTIVAPCVSSLPKCSSGLGGIASAGMPNDHVKDHFPGDARPVDSPISSMSGSSSPLSAVCDPTTSSSAMIRSSVDSVSKATGQKFLSAGSDVYSTGKEQSFQEYEKESDGAWSQQVEQSIQSNSTTERHEMYLKGECYLDRCMEMEEKYWRLSDCEDLCRETYSNLSNPSAQYQSCFMTDRDPCDPERERVERSEQTSNSTVSKATSPVSDESYGKRPAKRLKADVPSLVSVNQAESPKEQKPVVNENHACGETVQSEFTELHTKSPCSSLGDINADTDDMLEQGSEDAHNMEIVTEEELHCVKGDIEMKDSKTVALEQTVSGVNVGSRRRRGASILYALTAEELRDHMSSLINQHSCLDFTYLFRAIVHILDHDFSCLFQSKVTYQEIQLIEGVHDQNTCSLCGMERLLFEPPPRFCALCFKIINSTGCYYAEVENGKDKTSICSKCHHLSSSRSKYVKRSNYAETDAEAEWVPRVEGLTVRVVSSADRVLQVQPRFHEFFKQEMYPGEFPYKSKAILLFQKIEGVDVCLFAMYVQEYGSDCPSPNQRHVYLAYIDSVKYFRPEIKSASGEALRTFVYHEILIGYLDYCKKRGFVSCSIWACPSTKRDDYVLYCHPTVQKMPKSDKLRSWYQNLVKKAVKEGVVVERNTLSDFFLQPTNECKANISAARLPYCENDFWPGEAERLLEKKDDKTSQKKETQVGRLLRVAKRDDRKGNLEDILLVHKVILFIYDLLAIPAFRGSFASTVTNLLYLVEVGFALAVKISIFVTKEQNTAQKDRHPATTKQKHGFQRIEVEPLPETDDGDPTMESKYFDSRIDFLKHCQDNQFQFDTLRRAKHSTMMILYYLYNSTCSACHRAVDQCLVWRCLECLGCTFCDPCYKQNGESLHTHELRQIDTSKTMQKNTIQVSLLH